MTVVTAVSTATRAETVPPLPPHHQHVAPIGAGFELVDEAREVVGEDRLHAGVDRGGGAAFVFAELGEDLVAGGDVVVGPQRLHDPLRPPFVFGVAIGVEEVDHHRLASAREQLARRRRHRVLVERRHHFPAGVHALGHLQAQLAGDERLEPSGEPIGLRPGAAAELQHVPEAAGGDQSGDRELAFQQRVGGGGGAVHQQVQRRQVDPGLLQCIQHPERLVGGGGRDLGEAHVVRLPVQEQEVGEGAADVDRDAPRGRREGGCARHRVTRRLADD